MTSQYPAARIQLDELARRPMAAMFRLQGTIDLDPGVADLVKVRASQLNGCAFCIDMHWQDARAHGETEERLYSLGAWPESPDFDERERAALALCESITLITDGHVPDPVWERARESFGDQELAQLVFAITAINAWNRLLITARAEPGHYRPRLRDAA